MPSIKLKERQDQEKLQLDPNINANKAITDKTELIGEMITITDPDINEILKASFKPFSAAIAVFVLL
jgi:hypothetical protein